MDLLGVGTEARRDEGRAESNLISTHFRLSNWVLVVIPGLQKQEL